VRNEFAGRARVTADPGVALATERLAKKY